jgi:hypothetical protein
MRPRGCWTGPGATMTGNDAEMRRLPHAVLACATGLLLLMGILLVAAEDRIRIAAFSEATGSKLPSPWRAVGLPGSSKPFTRFDLVPLDGNTVLRVLADHSYANLVHDLPDVAVDARHPRCAGAGGSIRRLPDADLRRRETDDTALKVCLLFNAPAENLGPLEQSLLGVARAISGEKLPAATLCYVWDNTLPVGTVLEQRLYRAHPHDRGRQRDQGAGPLGQPPAGRGGGLQPRLRARVPHAAALWRASRWAPTPTTPAATAWASWGMSHSRHDIDARTETPRAAWAGSRACAGAARAGAEPVRRT